MATPVNLPDGLYDVTNDSFSAGFVISEGRVTMCAPILRKRLAYWMTVAERIGPVPEAWRR